VSSHDRKEQDGNFTEIWICAWLTSESGDKRIRKILARRDPSPDIANISGTPREYILDFHPRMRYYPEGQQAVPGPQGI
jgi:hypothetical protein